MKRILFIALFSLLATFSFGQYVNTQTIGSNTTLFKSRGGLASDSSFILLNNYADTAAANFSVSKAYMGSFIRVGSVIWVRGSSLGNNTPNRWYQFATVGSTGTVTSISQGFGITASPNPITTIGTITSDTTVIVSKSYFNNFNALNVKYADTAAMLLPYLRKSDTASMLSNYYNKTAADGRFVPLTRNVNTNAPLAGGGSLSTDLTLVADTGRANAQLVSGGSLNQVKDSLVALISSSEGGTVLSVATTDGFGINSSVASPTTNPNITIAVDTIQIATRYTTDSIAALKLNISDTSTMLSNYLRKTDTLTMLSPYLRKSDTLTMLAPYLRKTDTLTMLSPYLRKTDTATMLSPYLRKTDTATMLSGYTRVNRFLDTTSVLRALINTKGTGTVTSVALSLPSIFSVSGSPITTSGTITASLANQNANLVFASPTSGSPATPTFRSLVAADLPDLGGLYIKNQTNQQSSSNFNISGAGVVGGTFGVGTETPVSTQQINSSTPILTISNSNNTITQDLTIGSLNFYSNDASTTSLGGVGNITVKAKNDFNSSRTPTYMSFSIHDSIPNNGSVLGDVTEVLRLNSNGTYKFISYPTAGFVKTSSDGTVSIDANNYLLVSDTSSMLSNYLRKSDTATMLSNVVRTFGSQNVDGVKNFTDTTKTTYLRVGSVNPIANNGTGAAKGIEVADNTNNGVGITLASSGTSYENETFYLGMLPSSASTSRKAAVLSIRPGFRTPLNEKYAIEVHATSITNGVATDNYGWVYWADRGMAVFPKTTTTAPWDTTKSPGRDVMRVYGYGTFDSTITAGYLAQYSTNRGSLFSARSFTDKGYVDSAVSLRLRIADTATMLSGLTLDRVLTNGSLSGRSLSTGVLTINSTVGRSLNINSTNANGVFAAFQKSSVDQLFIGNSETIGGTSNNIDLYAVSGKGVNIYTDADASPALNINTSSAAAFLSTVKGLRFIGNSATDNGQDAVQSGGGTILSNLYRAEAKTQNGTTTIDATATTWISTDANNYTWTLPNTSSLAGGIYLFCKQNAAGTITLSGTIIDKTGTSVATYALTGASGMQMVYYNGSSWFVVN